MTNFSSFSCETDTFGDLEVVVVNGKGTLEVNDYGIQKFIDFDDEFDANSFYIETYDSEGSGSQGEFLHFVNETCDTGTTMCALASPADIANREIHEVTYEDRTYGPATITGDRLLIKANTFATVEDWRDIPLSEVGQVKEEHIQLEGVPDSLCPGQTLQFDIRIDGACKVSNLSNVTVESPYLDSAQSQSINIGSDSFGNIGSELEEYVQTVSIDVPSDETPKSIDAATVTVDGVSKTININIGNSPEELSIKEISDISDVCGGDRLSPDVIAENSGDCNTQVSVRITNDYNDTVITEGPTSLSAGEASPGTTSFFISEDVPDVPKDVSTIEYTVELSEADRVVDTETFNVNVSQPELTISSIVGPNQACAGEEVSIEVEAANTGGCDGSGQAILTNDLTDEEIQSDPTSLRADSSRGIRLTSNVPQSAADEGAVTYTATLFDSAGTVIESQSVVINIGSTQIALQNLEFPDTVCAGQTVDGSVEVSNSGDCPSDVTVAITQESVGETEALETVAVRDGSSRSVRFTESIPQSTISLEEDKFTLSAQVPSPDGNIITDTVDKTVNVSSTDMNVVGTTTPTSKCVGQQIDGTFTVANSGGCDGVFRILLTDSVSGSEQVVERDDLRSQRRTTTSFQDTMPVQAIQQGSIVYSYKLQSQISGEFQTVEEGQLNVQAQTSNLAINNVEAPEQQCIGTNVALRVGFENNGACETEYRVMLNDVTRGNTQVVDSGTVGVDTSTTSRFESELTSELSQDSSITYEIRLQKRLAEELEWQTVQDRAVTVSILKPDISIQTATYPEFDVPGQKKYQVTLANTSQCDTNIDVNISGENTNIDISSQSSVTITDDILLAADEEVREITVNDNTLGEQVTDGEFTVKPHRFINLNQNKGIVEIVGGFEEEVIYSGTIAATAIKSGENLEEQDSVVGALGVKSIQGTALPDSNNKDSIQFGALKGLFVQTSESTTVVMDGEVKGKGRSYRHTTASESALNFTDSDSADVETRSGPMSNAGALRRRFGFEPLVAGKSFFIDG